ncbi:alpha/beta fold hydrolase [Antrihabitans spumae]|uniref:Alpha/beta fold hydrolase n=1 Tax=Antrihabitans spumae TaxID=3373370 RepID=A0ABW7KIX7_9NOCA
MSEQVFRHPSTVSDWDDANRIARLRETRFGRRWRTLGRSRRVLIRVLLVVLGFAAAFAQYWNVDVLPERDRLALTRPEVYEVFDSADPDKRYTAVVDLVGLGSLDAGPTAAALPSLAAIGRVWVVKYDNGGIDTQVISRIIAERADQEGIDNLFVAGHSMGGVVALEVAEHIHQETDINLIGVLLDCTPVSLHAVRSDKRDTGENMLRWMGWVPGARESRSLRFLVEMGARRDRFWDLYSPGWKVDPVEFVDAVAEVLHDKLLSRNAASNGLIEAQFKVIVASGAVDNLEALAEPHDDKRRPMIVYLRPRRALDDDVVDVEYTEQVLTEETAGPQGLLLVVRMRNTGHANPIQRSLDYNAAIADNVAPFLLRIDDTGSQQDSEQSGP